jgi:hemolysin activation/secretion protein
MTDLPRPSALRRVACAAFFCLLPSAAAAQAAPDAGQLLRESQPPPPRPEALTPRPPVPARPEGGATVRVRGFEVVGSQRFDAATWNGVLAPFVGRDLGFAGLQAAADAVARHFREAAGVHVAATLPPQDLAAGLVRIRVTEARFGRLRSELLVPAGEPGARIPKARVEQIVGGVLAAGGPLPIAALESRTLIANELPGAKVSSLLAAGEREGETDVLLRIEPRPAFGGSATLDNFDARATGSLRALASIAFASPTGHGEQFGLSASLSEGKRYARAVATLPVGAAGWRAGVNASAMRYELVGDFAATGARGTARTAGLWLAAPLLRSATANANAILTLEEKRLFNEAAVGVLSDKRQRVAGFGLSGDRLDDWGGAGVWFGSVVLHAGELDLSRNADDAAADAAGPQRAGAWRKATITAGRLQQLPAGQTLSLNLTLQRAGNRNLDSSEQLALGGAGGVRAYPSIEGGGDQGFVASVAWRVPLSPRWRAELFYDEGRIDRERRDGAATSVPAAYSLRGAGVALDVQPREGWRVQATLASRIGSNPAAGPTGLDADGTKRRLRGWLLVETTF